MKHGVKLEKIILMLILITLSYMNKVLSMEITQFTDGNEEPIRQFITTDQRLIIVSGKKPFIINVESPIPKYYPETPIKSYLTNHESSFFTRSIDEKIIIACGISNKHLIIIDEATYPTQAQFEYYNETNPYDQTIPCSFVEIRINKYLLVYHNSYFTNVVLITKNPSSNYYDRVSTSFWGDKGLTVCEMLEEDKFYYCVYSHWWRLRGRLFDKDFKQIKATNPDGTEIIEEDTISTYNHYYQLFREDTNEELILFSGNHYEIYWQIISYPIIEPRSIDLGKTVLLVSRPSNIVLRSISIIEISPVLFLLSFNTLRYIYFHRIIFKLKDPNSNPYIIRLYSYLIKIDTFTTIQSSLNTISVAMLDNNSFNIIMTDEKKIHWTYLLTIPQCKNHVYRLGMNEVVSIINLGNIIIVSKPFIILSEYETMKIPISGFVKTAFYQKFTMSGVFVYHYVTIDMIANTQVRSPICQLIFHVCYFSCLTCSGYGTRLNQQCLTCHNGVDVDTNTNCIPKCGTSQTYHIDDEGNIICGTSNSCGNDYPYKIDKSNQCVQECNSNDFYSSSQKICYHTHCPENTYTHENECIDKCPAGFLNYHTYEESSRDSLDNTLVKVKKCLKHCPWNTLKRNNNGNGIECLIKCPKDVPYYNSVITECQKCPTATPYYDNDTKTCVDSCLSTKYLFEETNANTQCISQCDKYILIEKGVSKCVEKCPNYFQHNSVDYNKKECVDSCIDPNLIKSTMNECMPVCFTLIPRDLTKCLSECPHSYNPIGKNDFDCMEKCNLNPPDIPYVDDKTFQCSQVCEKKVLKIFRNNLCTSTCPDIVQEDNKCTDQCSADNLVTLSTDDETICVSSCKVKDSITSKCTECNAGFTLSKDKCVKECNALESHIYYEDDNYKCTSTLYCIPYQPFLDTTDNTCKKQCDSNNNPLTCSNNCPKCPEKQYLSQITCSCFTIEEIQSSTMQLGNDTTIIEIDKTILEIYNYSSIDDIIANDKADMVHIAKTELEHIKTSCKVDNFIIFKNETQITDALTNEIEIKFIHINDTIFDIAKCNQNFVIEVPLVKAATEKNDFQQTKFLNSINIDSFNPLDPFFIDICYKFKTENNTDIPRVDRYVSYYKDNTTICPKGFIFNKIDYAKQIASCTLNSTVPENSYEEFLLIYSQLLPLYNNDLIHCGEIAFTSEILTNIGHWIIVALFGISLAIDIWFAITNVDSVQVYTQMLYLDKKPEHQIEMSTYTNEDDDEDDSPNQNRNKSSKKGHQELVAESNDNPKEKQPKEKPRKLLDKFDDPEINDYEELLTNYNNRSFCQHYYTLLCTVQPIFYAFIMQSPKTAHSIRILLYINQIAFNCFFCALYYNDYYISYNYNNKYNFLSDFLVALYSYLTCIVSTFCMSLLVSTKKGLQNIMITKENDQTYEIFAFLKGYLWRCIIFILIHMSLLAVFWYYITCFCAVYMNNQLNWVYCVLKVNIFSQTMPFIFAMIYAALLKVSYGKKSIKIWNFNRKLQSLFSF